MSNAANEKGDLHLRNTEQLTEVMPFLPEDELKKLDTIYSKKEDWASYLIKDGPFITGQNPASSKEAAKQLLALL